MADYLGMGEETSFPTQYLGQQRAMADIAHRRASTQHQLATTDYIGAMTRETENRVRMNELEQDANEKIAGLSAIASEGMEERVDPVARLNQIANTYIQSGLVKKGAEVLKQASTITSQTALAAARQTQAAAAKQKADMQMVEKYSKMLGGVEDEEGWELIKGSIMEDEPQMKQWVDKLGAYSPEKAAAMQSAMTSYRDKAWAANARARTELYAKIRGASVAQGDTRIAISKEKLALEKQREARLAKEGGDRGARADRKAAAGPAGRAPKAPTAVGMPTKAEISLVEDQLKALNVSGDLTDHQEIAQEAKIRWKANPGLAPAQATAQVIQERVQSGDITEGKTEKKFFGLREHKVPGKVFSKAKPVGLPAAIEDAVVGQYYQTPKGVHKYLGDDKFEPVK